MKAVMRKCTFNFTKVFVARKTQCGNYGNLLSHMFDKKIRESNGYTKEITRVDFTKFLFSESEFIIFPHCGG